MPKACYSVGCNTGYAVNRKENKNNEEKLPSIFKAPKDNALLEKWKKAIPRADKELTCKDYVCELHFNSCDVETHFEVMLDDGTVWRKERERPRLKKGAIPCLFPNMPNYLSKPSMSMIARTSCICSAPGCDNFSPSTRCLENNITFHPFPLENEVLLKFWLVQMDRIDFTPVSSSCICSEHFEEDCFYYQKTIGKRVLEKDAVPTKFITPNELVSNFQSEINLSLESSVSTVPTVLQRMEVKKRKRETIDYDLDSSQTFFTTDSKDVSVQTAISGISTQLLPQARSSENSTVVLGSKDIGIQTRMDEISALLIENTSLQNDLTEL